MQSLKDAAVVEGALLSNPELPSQDGYYYQLILQGDDPMLILMNDTMDSNTMLSDFGMKIQDLDDIR